ncbi:acyl carrier protein [Pararhizobium haloflavum]|uniref:acyl carrier protein n=1 Tax=Pararhizobium haloflavum TaxID=2037914 RepID=UPI0013000B28|nr:acyl carrier protein [Pararhizobium haloflavum]
MTQLSDEIIHYIASYSDRDVAEVEGDTSIDDLGIHSLEMTEIVLDLEERYGVETDSIDLWRSFRTVNDIIHAVGELLSAKAA